MALPAPLEGARGLGLPCPLLASIASPCPCVSGVPCLLLCIWGLEVAQLHWGVPICLGCMFPRMARGSLCLQSQIRCQQAEGLASRGMTARSDLGNLLMVVLNTPGWFWLKLVVMLPRFGRAGFLKVHVMQTSKHLRECGSGCTGDPMSPTP